MRRIAAAWKDTHTSKVPLADGAGLTPVNIRATREPVSSPASHQRGGTMLKLIAMIVGMTLGAAQEVALAEAEEEEEEEAGNEDHDG